MPRMFHFTAMKLSKPIKYLGIDLSLNRTGLIVLEVPSTDLSSKSPKITERVVIPGKGKNRLEGTLRWQYIRDAVREMLPGINYAGVEGYAIRALGSRKLQMAEIGGIVRMELYEKLGNYFEAPPTAVKSFVGIGNADKDEVMLNVKHWFGYDTEDNDLADAFILAQMTRVWSMLSAGLTPKFQLFQIETVKNCLIKPNKPKKVKSLQKST